MAHSVEFRPAVRKEMRALPGQDRARIIKAAMALSDDPRPVGCRKLKSRDAYRIRVGAYCIIYEIHDDMLVVLVVRVAHRGEAYRG